MDINKKLIDQLSDLSRNIKSLTSEVRENSVVNPSDNTNPQKETVSDQNSNFLKSLESIFKKSIGEITKTNLKSSETLKNVIGGSKLKGTLLNQSPENEKTKGLKLPKDFGAFIEKIPKFGKGGTMDKKGFAIVGEKGPELLNLNKGDKIIPGNKILKEKNKLGADAIESLLAAENSLINSSDQNLNSPNKKNTESSLEDIKSKLLQKNPDYYSSSPKNLEEDAKKELKNLNKEKEGFTKENLQKLNKPKNPEENLNQENENLSPREQRRKEKEEKKKNAEDLLKSKPEKSDKKEILNKSKNFLLSQGKDILTGKKSLADIGKDASSLLGDKNELINKATGKASSLLTNKEFRGKNVEKLKGILNKKKEEKSSINTESPELKRPKVEPKKEESKETTETKETPKKETSKTETPKTETPKKETVKTETPKKSDSESKESIKSSDLDSIKSLLGKMVSLLEGPLYVESMESPFRPDSRRF
jgi:hypothetical protein